MLDNPIIRKPLYCHLWNILLLLAQHEPSEYIWNGERRTLRSGQLMTGRKKLSDLSGISESQIERILKYFKNEQQITQEKTNRYRIITILNWDKYQCLQPDDTTDAQPKDNRGHNQRTTEGQQKDTYKNDKTVNNAKELKNTVRFDRFYQPYPRKTNKQAAVKAFNKLNSDDALLEVMLAALEQQKLSDQWQRGIIPHPATWLNGRRWTDEMPHEETISEQGARLKKEGKL